ncbi:MAG: UMP kinase [Candidatus Pacearchaeota archaeon]
MKKKVVVISLGGSLIVPDDIDYEFLYKFKKVILKYSKKYKFVVVCGGGSVARKYIDGLEKVKFLKKKSFHQGLLGIASTRLNARFMTYFFGNDANKGIPHDMKEVKGMLRVYDVVFCGALRYAENETSDGTSAKLARFFDSYFINMTNIKGLYSKNPKQFKNAKFIPSISWKDFHKMANKEKFKPGQHFVLDQNASGIIMKSKIPTYILGKDLKQLEKLFEGKDFIGTKIGD